MKQHIQIILVSLLIVPACTKPTSDNGEPALSEGSAEETDSEDTEPSTPSYDCGTENTYSQNPIGQWRVCIARILQEDNPTIATQSIELLENDLEHIEELLEPSIVSRLQEVHIWVELNIEQFPGAVYHPSEGWLAQNNYPTYWAEGIQIGNATNYLNWTAIQPAMVLHELSHAWHHQVLGYNQMEIEAAYDAAMSSGIYSNVEYAAGGTQSAYATTNKQEYFAELTEAYFWTNDFYPFIRSELEDFDPLGYQALQNAWVAID
jgi:hypothetical protein